MSTKTGALERAFRAQTGGALLGVDVGADQLDLLRGDDGKLPSNVFRMARGKGRPEGAGNRRNEQLAKLICQEHGDPVLFMASIYSRPIDQMIELLLIADSTAEREDKLTALVERCEVMVKSLIVRQDITPERFDKLIALLDRILDAAQALKAKPGDLAVKVVALQKQAAEAVSRYVHSQKPVEVNAQVGFDATLLMVAPRRAGAPPIQQVMGNLQRAINDGVIDPAQLQDLRVVDGEFSTVGGDGDDEDGE